MFKRKIKFNSEKLLSISAMGISFITLIIFIYQTNLMSRQNNLSIMPYLDLSTTENSANREYTYQLNLKNHGIGPAIIVSVRCMYRGKSYDLKDYDNYFFRFLEEQLPELKQLTRTSASSLDRGMAIPANTSYNIFTVKDSLGYQLITAGLQKMIAEGFDYEIVYKSIQDERWMIDYNSEGPRKLK
ncbi:hypothetical protein [Flavilitoribacter nigricans]|uniref:Uncharacterized protein n=1 Tax=Flavilitoribacter nigricans (strain ATCC 23147 / DSM 23189 / NBRC 102662 / NCIMB 1420 / SS-2) TaxID=1122177 RepID=A0A2D0NB65_FLAN2|nr:hypothetical protein [Flavilitoribacter nigricans]PHN05727.1 hypothetical protein CRP01_14720 [Flavilitoribacter nigricans DSM 23189 = NBRC 102662]